ncbi:MAG: DUF3391 domain-containing protein, partial [Pseudomonadota bacterium]|nr:DUF3391 domain-containing protein [Pseudomonadota bacterium]
MKPSPPKEQIDIDDLRVGMFVHLDMSWMSHPFPLGSFKIASPDQLETIRALGVQRVRWSPTQSDALPPTEPTGWTRPGGLGGVSSPAASASGPSGGTDPGGLGTRVA